jgi:3-hydroxymyristoyl/3-hydroxydecanoyl-(acyl carrier protein) dehydratase
LVTIDNLREKDGSMSKDSIMKIIPYHEPFLLIDRILMLRRNELVAIKELKETDFFFNGHFTDFPIMPVSMIIEGLGQAATLLIRYNIEQSMEKYVLTHHVQTHQELDILAHKGNELVLNKPSFPGDMMEYEVGIVEINERRAKVFGRIKKNEEEIGKIMLEFGIVNRREFRSKK